MHSLSFVVFSPSQDGRTALIYASKQGDLDTVEKLLAAGAQPDHQDNVSYMVDAKTTN